MEHRALSRRIRIGGLALAAAAALAGCGGGGGSGAPAVPVTAGLFVQSFGANGIATLDGGPFLGATASAHFALPGPGPIRAAGSVRGSSVHARLGPDGSPDIGFAGSGYLLHPSPPSDLPFAPAREGIAAFARPDGLELLVERVRVPCVTGPSCALSGGGFQRTAVRVVTQSGEPVADHDNAFGASVPSLDPQQAIAEPSGALLVLGREVAGPAGARRNALRRLAPDALPDESFAARAAAAIDCPGFEPRSSPGAVMARRADGKLLLAQSYLPGTTPATSRVCVSRLQPDGSIDAGFGAGGYVILGWEFQWDVMTPVAIFPLPNGGSALFLQKRRELDGNSYYHYMIATMTADGSLDASRFDRGITGPTDLHVAKVEAVAMQADGKYLVAGYPVPGYDQPGTGHPVAGFDPSRPHIGRLHPEGGADLAFGPLGRGYTPLLAFGRRLAPRGVSLGQGGILVAGALGEAGPVNAGEATKFAVAKLTADAGPP